MDKILLSLIRYIGIGASVAFGWIFGENAATKIVDRVDAITEKKSEKKKSKSKKESPEKEK